MTRPRIAYIALNTASALILVMGLLSAVLIYRAADLESGDAAMYEQGADSAYPVSPYDTKKHLRDMELYGGKANVLAGEFRLWLAGLWQGRSLAYTVAFISILVSFGLLFTANRLAHSHPPGSSGDEGQDP